MESPFLNRNMTLPNGGGSYRYPGLFTGFQDTKIIPPEQQPYINPETKTWYTPKEYTNKLAYGMDRMTNPNRTSNELTSIARNINNERNDVAVGATDPFNITKSGINYSPTELNAIRKAYAGIYDPALNDVFSRLKDKEDDKKRLQEREDKIFATNESIRAWRATTGSKSSSDDSLFTDANIKTGAARANLTIDEFKQLDNDIKNYFVSRPQVYDPVSGKSSYVADNMEELMTEITDGVLTAEEGAQEITDGDLPEAVKLYLIGRLPMTPEEKDGWFMKIMKGIGSFFSS